MVEHVLKSAYLFLSNIKKWKRINETTKTNQFGGYGRFSLKICLLMSAYGFIRSEEDMGARIGCTGRQANFPMNFWKHWTPMPGATYIRQKSTFIIQNIDQLNGWATQMHWKTANISKKHFKSPENRCQTFHIKQIRFYDLNIEAKLHNKQTKYVLRCHAASKNVNIESMRYLVCINFASHIE